MPPGRFELEMSRPQRKLQRLATATRGAWRFALAATLAASVGCWEEIRYQPSADPEVTESAEPVDAQPASEPASDETPPVESAPAAEPVLPPVDASQLFGGQPASEPTAAPSAAVEPLEPIAEQNPAGENADPAPTTEETPLPGPVEEERPATPDGPDADGASTDIEPVVAEPTAAEPTAAKPIEWLAPTAVPEPTAAERLQAWVAASQWGLAVAMTGKNLASASIEPVAKRAAAAAAELGLELPAGEAGAPPSAAAIMALDDDAGPALAELVGQRLGPAERAAANLAIRTRLWLLTYTPRRDDRGAMAAAARADAEASGLPAELWSPLVQLVEDGAEFVEVRKAVFDLHRAVEAHLRADAGL
jgi:hypothetical protein